MKAFMDKDFLLTTRTAKHLYEAYAKDMPLIDYHCHISPKEIYEDRRFNNIAEIWLGGRQPDGSYFGDHYKWRLMRTNGIPESIVTGAENPFEQFAAFTKTLALAIGNPMLHWCNLELQKYFGIEKPLTEDNCKSVWDKCNALLQDDPSMTVRGIIKKSNVAYIGTTDDPVDSLEYHEKLDEDPSLSVKVCPSFRPDKALNIHKEGFAAYMEELARSANQKLESTKDVLAALSERVAFFKEHGCRASDHGLDYCVYRPVPIEETDRIYKKALAGENITKEEKEAWQTTLLLHLAREYEKNGIVMEIHYSCSRDNNAKMFALEGPDTGFDMISQNDCIVDLARFMSALDEEGHLPKMILFSLDGTDFDRIATLAGCFQSGVPGKIQMGPAWWFQDTKDGMEAQMRSLARLSLLGTFVGMLTDSRSFLSYTRHDYFRRILCDIIGKWVENGEYPNHEASLKNIVEGICCRNAARYFDLKI